MSIPLVNLHDFSNPSKKLDFVAQLGQAFNEIGFVAVCNHGLSDELSSKLYQAFQKFFALPQHIKNKYDISGGFGQRGYTGKSIETAKGYNTPDLKEFYHIGQENIPIEVEIQKQYPNNIWPEEVAELQKVGLEVFIILEQAGIKLLRAIAIYLKLDEYYFDKHVETGNSILRCIHYFPIENPDQISSNAMRAAAHEDINLITLLMGASADGLQIKKIDGSWEAVTALPNQIVVNVGDMLARLTNDKLKSTTHRVVNPPQRLMHLPRFSMPFFIHPRSDMDLTCLQNCIDNENPKKYNDITSGAYLNERLIELGLKS